MAFLIAMITEDFSPQIHDNKYERVASIEPIRITSLRMSSIAIQRITIVTKISPKMVPTNFVQDSRKKNPVFTSKTCCILYSLFLAYFRAKTLPSTKANTTMLG